MSAPDLSTTAAEDGGIPNPGLHKGKDVWPLTVNRAIHANTMTALDLPPQSLSLPSEADSNMATVAGTTQRAERTGDHSPHPAHCRLLQWRRYPRRDFLVTAASSTPMRDSARGLANSADSCGQTWVTDTHRDVCTRDAKCAGRQARHLEYPEEHEDSEWDKGRGYRVKQADSVACDAGSSGWMRPKEALFDESVVILSFGYSSTSGREIRSMGNSSFVPAESAFGEVESPRMRIAGAKVRHPPIGAGARAGQSSGRGTHREVLIRDQLQARRPSIGPTVRNVHVHYYHLTSVANFEIFGMGTIVSYLYDPGFNVRKKWDRNESEESRKGPPQNTGVANNWSLLCHEK
ncbi:hypothetical protein EDB85DRAFT_1894170 [Lactarius pseudohatsudake]|nr:hypothetical protein EDB85DRAFT_1894170 [Lactarius pseudohatsudake]